MYHARTTESRDEIFSRVFDVVWRLRRLPGLPAKQGEEADELQQAIESLQSLAAKYPETPKVALALGMAWFAIGNEDNGQRQLTRAAELDPQNTIMWKELGGVCLARNDLENAFAAATKAVAVEPDDAELLGNLAVIQLVRGNVAEAKTTIEHAVRLQPDDSINRRIQSVVNDVTTGKRLCPRSLAEMMQAPKRKPWWKRLFGG